MNSQYFVDNDVVIIWIDDAGEHAKINGEYNEGDIFKEIQQELDDNFYLYKYEIIESDPWYSEQKVLLAPLKEQIVTLKESISMSTRMIQSYVKDIRKDTALLLKILSKKD